MQNMMCLEGLTLKIESSLDRFFLSLQDTYQTWRCLLFFQMKKKKKKVDQKEKGKVFMDFMTVIWSLPYYFSGFPVGAEVKVFACNAGDLGSIPGSGRSPGEMATHSSIFA